MARTDPSGTGNGANGNGGYSPLISAFANFVSALTLTRPLLALLLSLLVSGVWFLCLDDLEPKSDWRMWFSKDDPYYKGFDRVEQIFEHSDTVIYTLYAEDGDQFTKDRLELISWLTDEVWHIPFARRVDSLTNFQHSYAEGDDIFVHDLVPDAAALSPSEIAALRETALAEPLLVNRQISADGKTTNVVVTLTMPGESSDETQRVVEAAEDIYAVLAENAPDQTIALTGTAPTGYALERINSQDLSLRLPIMFTIISILTIVLLRSFWATVAALSVVFLSVGAALGFAAFMQYPLHTGTSAVPIILVTIALADAVHLAMSSFTRQAQGYSKEDAIRYSVKLNALPVILTSITTSIGFLSLNFSAAPPFREMGTVAAFGVMMAMVLAFLIMPCVLRWIPAPAIRNPDKANPVVAAMASVPQRHPVLSLIVTCAIVAWSLSHMTQIETNDRYIGYFSKETQIRQHVDFTETVLPSNGAIMVILDAGKPQGVADPAYLKEVDQLADWLRAQPEVTFVNSIDLVFKKQNQTMNNGDPAYYSIPENQNTAAQYLLLYEMSLRQGQDLSGQLNVDKSMSLLTATIREMPDKRVKALEHRVRTWLNDNLPPAIKAQTTGPSVLFAHLSVSNIHSMIMGTGLAILLISLMTAVAIKNFRLGLLSLIVNVAPIAMAFGAFASLFGYVNLSASVTGAVCIGIVVDFTIHFLTKYRLAVVEQNMTAREAVDFTFRTVGPALVVLSVVLAVGFGVVGLSDFEITQTVGRLTAMAIVFGLMLDFFFLPAALIVFSRFLTPRY